MIILIDKPGTMTSHDVLRKIKRASAAALKIGHTGTLDPMCTGVLPVLTGKYTKLSDILPSDKTYKARLKLGIKTDTQDITGSVLEKKDVNVNIDDLNKAIQNFVGEINQVPPMYSALKVDGVRLYKLARQGMEVDRKARKVTIYNIECNETEIENEYDLIVSCSSGTYIRTLCEDIGDSLGCGATMAALRRTESNGFSVENCHSLESATEYASNGNLDKISITCEEAFKKLDSVIVPVNGETFYLNGGELNKDRLKWDIKGQDKEISKAGQCLLFRVYNDSNIFLGLGKFENDRLKSLWNELV